MIGNIIRGFNSFEDPLYKYYNKGTYTIEELGNSEIVGICENPIDKSILLLNSLESPYYSNTFPEKFNPLPPEIKVVSALGMEFIEENNYYLIYGWQGLFKLDLTKDPILLEPCTPYTYNSFRGMARINNSIYFVDEMNGNIIKHSNEIPFEQITTEYPFTTKSSQYASMVYNPTTKTLVVGGINKIYTNDTEDYTKNWKEFDPPAGSRNNKYNIDLIDDYYYFDGFRTKDFLNYEELLPKISGYEFIVRKYKQKYFGFAPGEKEIKISIDGLNWITYCKFKSTEFFSTSNPTSSIKIINNYIYLGTRSTAGSTLVKILLPE